MTQSLEVADAAFSAFLARTEWSQRNVAVHDSDADGVTAGVVWQRALERLGFTSVLRIIPDRTRDAWRDSIAPA